MGNTYYKYKCEHEIFGAGKHEYAEIYALCEGHEKTGLRLLR